MAKYNIPEDEVNRIRDALLAAFDAAIAEVEKDEMGYVEECDADLHFQIGSSLRCLGRSVCGQIEDGKFKNAAA